MSLPITSPQLTLLREHGHASAIYAAIFKPSTVYSARLASVPSSLDKVYEISFTSGVGTLSDVKKDMDIWIGSTAGAHDLGIARIRKVPIAGTFYISEESDVRFQTSCHLTVVNYFDLHARHIYIDSGEVAYMDRDIAYSNQHTSFDPVPVMGGHRAAKKTVTAVTVWDGSESWVIGSTISAYAWSCATAAISSGTTTSVATFEFDTFGWHLVYLTVTAANGKTATGVRYVYVYDADHLPEPIFDLGNPSVDYETGGWSFEFSMAAADVADVPDRALVILFREDYYGNTEGSIGALTGCENIECVGKISEESLTIDPEQSIVTFRVQGYHYWFQRIMGFPSGIEQVTSTPDAWTEMQSLTVDKALFNFFHWRSTATVIMDVSLTGDARLASEISSVAGNLWSQIQEFSFNTILAKPGVDRFGRLFVRIEPQCVPLADRDFPIVMTIEKDDWEPPLRITRVTVSETGLVDVSGVSVDSSSNGLALFGLSPGHIMKQRGMMETVDRLLLENQSLTNEQAGLLLAWRDNEFPSIEMPMTANNPVFDCFPPQVAEWSLEAGDNARRIEIDGSLIPRHVERRINLESGFIQTVVTFELVTSAEAVNATIGDVPGSGTDDLSTPPRPPAFPPLPDFSPILSSADLVSTADKSRVLMLDQNVGLVYTTDFDTGSPHWTLQNAGLGTLVSGSTPAYAAADEFFVTPNGTVYVFTLNAASGSGWAGGSDFLLARAPSIGSAFTILHSYNLWNALYGAPTFFGAGGIISVGYNPLYPDQVIYITREGPAGPSLYQVFFGNAGSFSAGLAGANLGSGGGSGAGPTISYYNNQWLQTFSGGYRKFNANGSAAAGSGSVVNGSIRHLRAGTTGRIYVATNVGMGVGAWIISPDNLVTQATSTDGSLKGQDWIRYAACDPTGAIIMAQYGSFSARSFDYGTTWSTMSAQLAVGGPVFAYGGAAEGSGNHQWVAFGGTQVYHSTNNGGTWVNKTGDLASVIGGIPAITQIQVLG